MQLDWISINISPPMDEQEVMVTVETREGERYVWCDIYTEEDGFIAEWAGDRVVTDWAPMPKPAA